MAKRRKSSKRATPMAEKVVVVHSPAEKDTSLKREEEENDDGAVDESPLRSIFCLKKVVDMERIEETEDCFILEFNPFSPIDTAKLSASAAAAADGDVDDELSVVAERGQVACRDYPHSRHLCLQFPFATTPHEQYCELCYCYVCDSAAPCECWMTHCHASEQSGYWKTLRNIAIRNVRPRTSEETLRPIHV